jgi:hypothetical protein
LYCLRLTFSGVINEERSVRRSASSLAILRR